MNKKFWHYLGIMLDVILVVGLSVSILSGNGTTGDYLILCIIVVETLVTVWPRHINKTRKQDDIDIKNENDLQA